MDFFFFFSFDRTSSFKDFFFFFFFLWLRDCWALFLPPPTPSCFTFREVVSSTVAGGGLSSSLSDTLSETALSKRLLYSASLPNKLVWGLFFFFSTCSCGAVISFYSDVACDDCREGGSSKGQARGHSEACQEFQSRPLDLWLPQNLPCAAWLCKTPPRHAHGLPSPPVPSSPAVLSSTVRWGRRLMNHTQYP